MIVDEPLPLEGLPDEQRDFAGIPLPEKRSELTVLEHDRHYATPPGRATDVLHADHGPDGRGVKCTVQCAACLRTATGHSAWWVIVQNRWNHTPDENGATRQPTKYKRCPDCQAAERHPGDAS